MFKDLFNQPKRDVKVCWVLNILCLGMLCGPASPSYALEGVTAFTSDYSPPPPPRVPTDIEAQEGIRDNYQLCQILVGRLSRMAVGGDLEEEHVTHHFRQTVQKSDKGLRSLTHRDYIPVRNEVLPTVGNTAYSTNFSTKDGDTEAHTHWEKPGMRFIFLGRKLVEVGKRNLKDNTGRSHPYLVIHEPEKRVGNHPQYQKWLKEGLTHPNLKVWSLTERETEEFMARIQNDLRNEPGLTTSEALVPPKPRLYDRSDSTWVSAGFSLRLLAFMLGTNMALHGDANPMIVAGMVLIPPHKIIRWLTGYTMFKRKPITTPMVPFTHDGEVFFNAKDQESYGVRTNDGFNFALSKDGKSGRFNIMVWYPSGSHYERIMERANAPLIAETPAEPPREEKAEWEINEHSVQMLRGEVWNRLSRWPSASPLVVTPEIKESALRIKKLADQVNARVLERSSLIETLLTALVSKEHLFIFGPSGNAKTTTVRALLQAFTESDGSRSYARLQIKHDMTENDLFGPPNPRALMEDGIYERLLGESFLAAKHAVLDELMDLRSSARRDMLDALEERGYSEGGRHYQGKLETAVGISNRFIPEVMQKPNGQLDETARALIDRFALFYYLGWEFEKAESDMELIERGRQRVEVEGVPAADKDTLHRLSSGMAIPPQVKLAMNLLWKRTGEVLETREHQSVNQWLEAMSEGRMLPPPYRTTRVFSPRGKQMSGSILRADTTVSWMMNGAEGTPEITLNSLINQVRSMTASGSSEQRLQERRARTSNPFEQAQIDAILFDRREFQKQLELMQSRIEAQPLVLQLNEIAEKAKRNLSDEDILKLSFELNGLLKAAEDQGPNLILPLERQSESGIATLYVLEEGHKILRQLVQRSPELR